MLRWLRRTNGCALAVPDRDIEAAQFRFASKSGRFVQPASAACLAALECLRNENVVQPEDSGVLLLTGSGSNAPPVAIKVAEPCSLTQVMAELD